MYVDAYLFDEQAAHIQRERTDAAAQARLVRLIGRADQPADTSGSIGERVTAAFRPAPEPCPTC